MTKLTVLEVPHPILSQKASPVERVDADIQKTLADMLETMYASNGVGLAANQVGLLKRMVVIDVAGEGETPDPIQMVNPEIVAHSETMVCHNEGCLSVPRQYADVERFETVRVRYLNENGQTCERNADGLLSICIQHELDHLDGILFIDHLSQLKRSLLLKKLEKRRRKEAKEKESE